VDDIARGTLLGLQPLEYQIINLGGHEVIKINELIHLLETLTGKKAKIKYYPAHPADMATNWADISKAGKVLGWVPVTGLNQGLASLVHWYNQERAWASGILTP
jgi:nucleoside-diphosphate-sugar epimerase